MTPRDGGGTQNRQKSATDGAARAESSRLELCRVVTEENEVKYDCRQKMKMQTSAKLIFQFFARLHFLTQILHILALRFSLGYGYLIWG